MNDLLLLVKLLTALYQAKTIKDKSVCDEILEVLNEIPVPKEEYVKDRPLRESIRGTIHWLIKQDDDDETIRSALIQRVSLFTREDEEIKKAIDVGLELFPDSKLTRKYIFRQINDVNLSLEGDVFQKKFKKQIRDFYFKDLEELDSDDWMNLLDVVQERVNSSYEEHRSEIIASINTKERETFTDVINRAKQLNCLDGVIKTPWQGVNNALAPDYGLRRSKYYMLEAMTNRGKSLTMAHIVIGVGLYNKPALLDKRRIPTVVLESAEDTLEMIVQRMYKLALYAKHDREPDFISEDESSIVDIICDAFMTNGWYLIINQVDPSKDSCKTMVARIRKLQLSGHEVIFWGYDYPGLNDISKVMGESRSDKLQLHVRYIRSFIVANSICFVGPWQLSPDAKRRLQEADDESEVYFIKEVAGKSLTEGTTKITNEVDCALGIHVAKGSYKSYWCFMLGKMRGEGCVPEDRFGIYDIDPIKGLPHDINTKKQYRKSLTHKLDEKGESVPDIDDFN